LSEEKIQHQKCYSKVLPIKPFVTDKLVLLSNSTLTQ